MRDGPLESKYTVTHKHGEPIDPARKFFVLSPHTDIVAWEVLLMYAAAVSKTHPILAESIMREYLTPDNKPQERE